MVYRLSSSADVHICFSQDSEVSGATVVVILQETQISTTNTGKAEGIGGNLRSGIFFKKKYREGGYDRRLYWGMLTSNRQRH